MNPESPITLREDGPVAVVTLARPPVNAVDEAWLACLDGLLGGLEGATPARVLLLRSSARVFCAGADLALMRSRFDTTEGQARMVRFVRAMQRVYLRLEALPLVTIAEIGGAALGGGLELALCCDLRIAATEATLGLPEARLGLIPGAGGTQRLTRIAGEATAKRLILGAEVVGGAEAAALGIVQWSVPGAALEARARALAEAIAGMPAGALAACKRGVQAAATGDPSGYAMEVQATAKLLADAETRDRVRRFLERRR
ncbi:MAG TPA: enoyl-CoA hydratase/isomerase family protein [Burkholderiales bacterium]